MSNTVEVTKDGNKWAVRIDGIKRGISYADKKQAEYEASKIKAKSNK